MIVKESIFRDVLRLLFFFVFRWIILILPVRAAFGTLNLIGDISWKLSKRKKRQLREILARIKPNDISVESVTKQFVRNHYVDRLLIFIFPKFGHKEVEEFLEIEGLEQLDKALRKSKGVIVVHGHFGPVHLPLLALARLGYRIKQIGNPSDENLSWIGRNVMFRLRMTYERKMPTEIIRADSFLRPVIRWLRDNGIIMITGDGSGTKNRIGRHKTFSFLGHEMMFPLGPYILSEKTGAVLLPMFIVPGSSKRYKIIIEEPFWSELNDSEERILDITEQFIKRLEHYVVTYPGYMHFLDRFHPGGIITGD